VTSQPPATTTARAQELRAEMDARLQDQRNAPLPGWLAGRTRRRVLAVLPPAVVLACGLAAAARPDDTAGILLMLLTAVLAVAAILLLRRASRLLDAVPDRLLDEREIGERNAAHRTAHGVTVILFGLLAVVAIVDGLVTRSTGDRLIPGDNWIQVLITGMLVATMIPAAVITWRWSDLSDETD
jgi:drug/metabolite transporter (DMT)-like permease